jgi:EAL domain-containing protein (putative c-di-GMP-specific phosphodiesterase class I)
MNLELIAEGVESASQIEFLLQKGCHLGQGYYFSEPLDSDGIDGLINGLPTRSQEVRQLHSRLPNRARTF